jgi:hypothetical protein
LKVYYFITVFILVFSSARISAQKNPVKFTDITAQSGIDFRYNFGDYTYENIVESSGSGVSILDYDGDGYMDLYLLNGTYLEGISDPEGIVFKDTPDKLYRNNGDGTFSDVTEQAGVGDRHWSMAASTMDYDGDGDVDIYLLNFGPNVFYLNNGNGTFSDITDSLGLRGPAKLNGFTKWSIGAVFFDYNLDGRVDLFMGNFLAFDSSYFTPGNPDIMPHPSEYKGQASLLYLQLKNGTFREFTRQAGLYYPDSKCMGLTVFDYDEDGDLDIFQANDHQMNFLFRNNGDGTYSETGQLLGVAVNDEGTPTGSMHGTIGDVDGDGLVDILVADLRYSALYRNLGGGNYMDITESSGIKSIFSGKGAWYSALLDYDNDQDLDIFSANGYAEELILQEPLLLENNGSGHLNNVGPQLAQYFREKRSGRGAAIWDFDNDGDQDIIVSHVDLQATPALLRNDGGNNNHWLGLTLIGYRGPASAIGARVSIKAGGLKQVAINQWGTGYLSYNDPRIHFGLGKTEVVQRLEILWPDGNVQVLEQVAADRYLTIKEGEGIE